MLIHRNRTRRALTFALGATAGLAAALLAPADADACGCFAPPDPSVPVVQAGEEIVFSYDDGVVTAHIKIFYEGPAEEFGWLLPVPGVPDMALGVDELFAQLLSSTQPRYRLNATFDGACEIVAAPRAGGDQNFDSGAEGDDGGESVVVKADSIGPFDFAVLKADDRQEMFDWLTANGYFIPTSFQSDGEDDVLSQYIRPGAFFLALRLRAGSDTGDLQPIVLRYPSDLPMIPIVLTSMGANADMGVRVWVLGQDRAIPRNYRHTVLNDEYIDWFSSGSNYNDVIVNATNEAPEGQTFVTEYAGSTDRMEKVLNWDGRFGDRGVLSRIEDVGQYVQALRFNGFTWDSALIAALRAAIPYPEGVAVDGITEELFYANIDWYLGGYRQDNPDRFEGYAFDFDPVELTDVLWERVVTPTLEAGALFDTFPKMTRMYTTLSPEEMTLDPTFSFNPSLPDVDNEHNATLRQLCSSGQPNGETILVLPDGREFFVNNQADWLARNRQGVPFSRRIEVLAEEGPPRVEINNASRISQGDAGSDGCRCAPLRPRSGQTPGLIAACLIGVALLFGRRRR